MQASDPQPILDLEEAIALLQDKYDLQIIRVPLDFTNIWMEYIPIKQDEEVALTPYWCFLKIDKNALGKNFSISLFQLIRSVLGTIIRLLLPFILLSLRYAIICNVFPSPISSAKHAPKPLFLNDKSHFTPIN